MSSRIIWNKVSKLSNSRLYEWVQILQCKINELNKKRESLMKDRKADRDVYSNKWSGNTKINRLQVAIKANIRKVSILSTELTARRKVGLNRVNS